MILHKDGTEEPEPCDSERYGKGGCVACGEEDEPLMYSRKGLLCCFRCSLTEEMPARYEIHVPMKGQPHFVAVLANRKYVEEKET